MKTLIEARTELKALRATWTYAFAHGSGCAYGNHPDRQDIFRQEDDLIAIIQEHTS